MNKRISVGLTTALVLIAVTITFTATMIYAMNSYGSKFISSSQRREYVYDNLYEIDNYMRQYYYREPDENILYSELIHGYMNGLQDPSAAYLTSEQVAQRNQQARGTAVSLGIEAVKDVSGYININNIYSESPAAMVGIQPGDIIIGFNEQDVLELGYDEAVKLLYGIEGTKITVHYTHEGEEHAAEMMYTTIEIRAIESAQLTDLYYIRIKSFNDATPAQFAKALKEADNAYQDGSVAGLVIDVRDIAGGYSLETVRQILSNFVGRGTLYYGTYRDGTDKVLDTSDNDTPYKIPMAVLVNANTRGFAELFADVLGNLDHCRIVGNTTAGMGTYNTLFMLPDGSALDLPVAELHTPGSLTFNLVGIKPDFEIDAAVGFVMTNIPEEEMDLQFRKAAEVIRSMRG